VEISVYRNEQSITLYIKLNGSSNLNMGHIRTYQSSPDIWLTFELGSLLEDYNDGGTGYLTRHRFRLDGKNFLFKRCLQVNKLYKMSKLMSKSKKFKHHACTTYTVNNQNESCKFHSDY